MEIIEIPHFTEIIDQHLADDEYGALQWFLALQPTVGDIISKTGGARKARWSSSGQGKRGGLRVIYFYHKRERQIWMLTIYSKSRKKDLTSNDTKLLKSIVQEIKQS